MQVCISSPAYLTQAAAGGGGGPPVFDNANSVTGLAVVNVTTSAWVIGGSNRLLVAGMGWGSGTPPTYSAIKWEGSGGASLTQIGATLSLGAFARLAMARLIAPNAVSGTLYGELSGTTDEICLGGVSVTGAHQTTPLGSEATNSAQTFTSPATATVDVTSATGDLVIDFCFAIQSDAGTVTVAVGGGQTMHWEQENIGGGFEVGTQSTEPGAGTVTMSEIITFNQAGLDWGIMGVSIKPA